MRGASAAATTTTDPDALPPPTVRVLLAAKTALAHVAADRPVTLQQADGSAVRLNLPKTDVAVSLDAAGWRLGDQRFPPGDLLLFPADAGDDAALSLDGRRYRGRLRLRPRGDDAIRFDVVNELDLENYLQGVLPKELPGHWHAEAFEAQAVVARTYAAWELKTAGPSRGYFDVYATVASQVYGGLDAETAKSRAAVRATRGQVATHPTPAGPRIFKAYFHSTCGGVTLGVESAFNEPPMKALSATKHGQACAESKYYRWTPFTLSKPELTRRLQAWGKRADHPVARMGTLDRLEVADRNEFGRPTRFKATDVRGNAFSLIAEEARWSINTDAPAESRVYSGFFEPINNQSNVVISDGGGWGHGVGMCQFAAEHWAAEGRDHVWIVGQSYPGTSVVRAY